jgi:hypothetical protein
MLDTRISIGLGGAEKEAGVSLQTFTLENVLRP